MIVSRHKLIEVARSYLGTPFHHQGRLPGIGLDCAGLVICAHRACGIELRDVEGYSRYPQHLRMRQYCRENAEEIPVEKALPGDTILFWVARPGLEQHLAMLTDYGIVHAVAGRKVVEAAFTGQWRNQAATAYRVSGVDPQWSGPAMPIPPDFDPEQERRRLRQGGCCH